MWVWSMVWGGAVAAVPQVPVYPEEMACEAGSGPACAVLANAYARGEGVPKDEFRASQLYRRGCDLGDAHACMFLAEAYRTGVGTRMDQGQAVELYTRACEIGDPLACRSVGDLYTMGALGTADGKSAGVWYALGCDLGDAQACTAAALWVERGDAAGIAGIANGLGLFEKGCNGGHHRACGLLAERYIHGSDGATKDLGEAYKWYAKGCSEPYDIECCRELGVQQLEGQWVPLDLEGGLRQLDRACFQNDAIGCRYLAATRLKEKNYAEALLSGERGCDLGDVASCRTADRARIKLSSTP